MSFEDAMATAIEAMHGTDLFGISTVHYIPPQGSAPGYKLEQAQWDDQQDDSMQRPGGEVTQESARCQILRSHAPDTMPPPRRGGTIVHEDVSWHISNVRLVQQGGDVLGWRLRLSRSLSVHAAPGYHGRFDT